MAFGSTTLKQQLMEAQRENEELKREVAILKKTTHTGPKESYHESTASSIIYTDDDSDSDLMGLETLLEQFNKVAATGQFFLRYSMTEYKPVTCIVKVSFDNKCKPKIISWGSGCRFLAMNNIHCIAWGLHTPTFMTMENVLDQKLYFSIIAKSSNGNYKILNLKAQSCDIAELWVKGLRKLIGQTDAVSALKVIKFKNVVLKYDDADMKDLFYDEKSEEIVTMMNELRLYRNITAVFNSMFDEIYLYYDNALDVDYEDFSIGLMDVGLTDVELKQLFDCMNTIKGSGFICRNQFILVLLQDISCIELSNAQNKIIRYVNEHNEKYKYQLPYKKCLYLNHSRLLISGYIKMCIKVFIPSELIELCVKYYLLIMEINAVTDAMFKKMKIYQELYYKIDMDDNEDISQDEFVDTLTQNINISETKIKKLFWCMRNSAVNVPLIDNMNQILNHPISNDNVHITKDDCEEKKIILRDECISKESFVSFFMMPFVSKLLNILKSSINCVEDVESKLQEIETTLYGNNIDYSVYLLKSKGIMSKEELIEQNIILREVVEELKQPNDKNIFID